MDYGKRYDTLNEDQKDAFHRLVKGENLFITGNAGTGKSYLVRAYDEYCALHHIQLVKVAPTGVSAMEIGGATLHKQFNLAIGLDFEAITEESFVKNKKLQFMKRTDVILIDEISMVRIDIFDRLMQLLYFANQSRKQKRRKPIQLIFVGDFFQLAPVIAKDEKPHLNEYYRKDIQDGYCFQSRYWRENHIHLCNLTKVIRQSDIDFCTALDECKEGDVNCLKFLKTHSSKEENEDAIWLCGKNATADQKNREGLAKIDGKLYCFQATYSGDVTQKDRLCDDEFQCKIGARVVMLANGIDYQNGSMGEIVRIDENDENIVILVKIQKTGKIVEVKKTTFPKYHYESKTIETPVLDEAGNPVLLKSGKPKVKKSYELVRMETGYAEQFPMRIGYAVTIHKSQGQTYDAINLMPEIFANGQLYVALSRCKSVEGIYIAGFLSQRMVMCSEEVLKFYNHPEEYEFFGTGSSLKAMMIPEKYISVVEAFVKKLEAGEYPALIEELCETPEEPQSKSKPTPISSGTTKTTTSSNFWKTFRKRMDKELNL